VSGGNATVSYNLPAGTSAGSYSIEAVYNAGAGFSGSSDATPGTLTVNPKGVTVNISGGPFTYDGSSHAAAVTTTPAVSHTMNYSRVSPAYDSATPPTDAGTYTVTVTITNSDYALSGSGTGSITISPAPITATAGGGTSTYDGATKSPSACVVSGTYTGTLACANNPASVGPEAGTTTISPVVSGPAQSNFEITLTNGSYEIKKAPVTATAGSGSGFYNGSTQSPSACVVSGTYTGTLACTNNPASVGPEAGTTTIVPVVSGPAQSNFEIALTNGSYEIKKAPVTATAGSGSGFYNGSTQSPSACVVSGTYTGTLACTNNPASVGPEAGTTTIAPIVSGPGLTNFAVTTVNGSYEIKKAPVTATAGSGSGFYNGATQSPSTCVVSGVYTGVLACANNPDVGRPGCGDDDDQSGGERTRAEQLRDHVGERVLRDQEGAGDGNRGQRLGLLQRRGAEPVGVRGDGHLHRRPDVCEQSGAGRARVWGRPTFPVGERPRAEQLRDHVDERVLRDQEGAGDGNRRQRLGLLQRVDAEPVGVRGIGHLHRRPDVCEQSGVGRPGCGDDDD
jgi:hypothetical protein